MPFLRHLLPVLAAATCFAGELGAQQGAPLAYVRTDGVSVSGSLSVANGRAAIGNNGMITAGEQTADVTLARGGKLRICSSTAVHLSADQLSTNDSAAAKPSVKDASQAAVPSGAGLMFSLDRGALEASYTPGKYSDVILTPDLRILISGPGAADLKLRVSAQGDTCVDNRGAQAPYVTVSSLMDGGVYRVKSDQRVLFEHGSLQQVVDNEQEPCGCPEAADAATAAQVANNASGAHPGGPSSTPADTTFPLAVSEGLKPPPAGPTTPVVPVGTPHAQVTASLSSDTPPGPPPANMAPDKPAPEAPVPASTAPVRTAPVSTAPPRPPGSGKGFFHSIGHFFSKVFGG